MDSAGAIADPLMALVLLAHFGIRSVFWAAAVPGALAVMVALSAVQETGRSTATSASGEGMKEANLSSRSLKPVVLPASFYLVFVAVTLFSLGNSSDMFLVMRAQRIGIPVSLAPLLGLVFNLTYTLGSWPAGWCSDHFSRRGFSRRWLAAAGYLILAGVYFVFGRAPSTLAIWITMAVYGAYYALTQPVLKALVVETVAPETRGRALGVYFFSTSVATLAASLITGGLWNRYGASVPFYVSAGIALVSAMLLCTAALLPRVSSVTAV
jgi:MFS family permease